MERATALTLLSKGRMSVQNDADLDITVASRSASSFEAAQESHPALRGVAFVPCDIDDTARLAEVLQARLAPGWSRYALNRL